MEVMEVEINDNKTIEQFCTDNSTVMEAFDKKGNRYFAKLINIPKSKQKGYDQCLQFNEEVLGNLNVLKFKEHFLAIRTILAPQSMEYVAYVTEPYQCNLKQFITNETIQEYTCQYIFHQILKAVYSLMIGGYWHRNLRAQHFVRVGETWKLQSLVLNDNYSKADGFKSVYLWSPSHEPPEYISGMSYSDQQYKQMTVWNLGSILLHMLLSSHQLQGKKAMDQFQGQPFTLEAIGIDPSSAEKISIQTRKMLAKMLHHDPNQRIKLSALLEDQIYQINKTKKLTEPMHKPMHNFQAVKLKNYIIIENLMANKEHPQRKFIELYKSYFDKSLILTLIMEKNNRIGSSFWLKQLAKDIYMMTKYSLMLVSLVNIFQLAESLKKQRNIFKFDPNKFIQFKKSPDYSLFCNFVNSKLGEQSRQLTELRKEITLDKHMNNMLQDEKVISMLQRDFRSTNFQQIKQSYRMILKITYNSISQDYNRLVSEKTRIQLARLAMLLTYCLTIDKLYILQHIPENFKFFFEWMGKPASHYIPFNDFRKYILNAPVETLINNSRYIFKKYYKDRHFI